MTSAYNIDYGLPFIPSTVKRLKPCVLVDIGTRSAFYCVSVEQNLHVIAKGSTPIDAMIKWEKRYNCLHPISGGDI